MRVKVSLLTTHSGAEARTDEICYALDFKRKLLPLLNHDKYTTIERQTVNFS